MREPAVSLLQFVWEAYDLMLAQRPVIDGRDLERSITQLLVPRINELLTGDEPFFVLHGPFERETMAAPPAQPPAYDLAFVLRADERVMWPLEAKVLETPGRTTKYERDLREEFLTCRYAPFSSSGAMLGYLLSGATTDVFANLAQNLNCALEVRSVFAGRPMRVSRHQREVPTGKSYSTWFECYHLILEYHGQRRSRKK